MKINKIVEVLMTFGLLCVQICGHAQTPNFEESNLMILQDTLTINTLLIDSASVSNNCKAKCSAFNAKQLILPGVLIVVGSFGVHNEAFRKLNADHKNKMDKLRGNHFFHADDYIQYLPALTYLTFGSVGIKSKHTFKERISVEATAYLTMAALTNIGKYTFKERRPDSNARNSFPSGHTATVFTGAELMREEYGFRVGLGAYSVAAGVAFLRLYNGRHWLNDVIAGVGVGILSARIGFWMLPLYQSWFKWNSRSAGIVLISPAYNPMEHTFSVNLAYTF